jgi:hypothetical protein
MAIVDGGPFKRYETFKVQRYNNHAQRTLAIYTFTSTMPPGGEEQGLSSNVARPIASA